MELDFNTVLALAFGAWAGVVGWLGAGIRSDIQELGKDLKDESRKLNQYIVQTETRLAKLESRYDNNRQS
jgi:hypothetical protein